MKNLCIGFAFFIFLLSGSLFLVYKETSQCDNKIQDAVYICQSECDEKFLLYKKSLHDKVSDLKNYLNE